MIGSRTSVPPDATGVVSALGDGAGVAVGVATGLADGDADADADAASVGSGVGDGLGRRLFDRERQAPALHVPVLGDGRPADHVVTGLEREVGGAHRRLAVA